MEALESVSYLIESIAKKLKEHTKETDNPHKVTKEQIGLGNVDNTSDKEKVVGSADKATSADSAAKLTTAHSIQTDLASSAGASFDGSADVTPGVKGVLGVANGGTGYTSASEAASAFAGSLGIDTSDPTDTDYYIAQTTTGSESETAYSRKTHNSLWNYTKAKISSVLGLTKDEYGGKAASAGKVDNTLTVQLNGGTSEGTSQFTYNGSSAKKVDITPSTIGLGNVNNTADSAKSVASAAKLTVARKISLSGDATGSASFDGSADKDIAVTIADFTGATSTTVGTHGTVPAPAAGDQEKFLRGDGTWAAPSTNVAESTDDDITTALGYFTD